MKILLIVALILLASPAFAQREDMGDFDLGRILQPPNQRSVDAQGVRMGRISVEGSGCRSGQVRSSLSNNRRTLSLLFDNYIVEAGGGLNRKQQKRQCSVTVPFHVPPGYQVSVVQVDYRGYHFVPANAKAVIESTIHLISMSGERRSGFHFPGIRRKRVFNGRSEGNFLLSSQVHRNLQWSPCGEDFIMILGSELKAETNRRMRQTYAAIDSLDTQASVSYHLNWRRCQNHNDPVPPLPITPGRPWGGP